MPPAASEPTGGADVETASGTKIPAHLLERAKRRKAAAAGGEGGAVAAGAAATATANPMMDATPITKPIAATKGWPRKTLTTPSRMNGTHVVALVPASVTSVTRL